MHIQINKAIYKIDFRKKRLGIIDDQDGALPFYDLFFLGAGIL